MAYTGLVPHPADKDYGVVVTRFAGREGRLKSTEHWFRTEEARAKWLEKEAERPNWYRVDAYHDPRVGVVTA